MKKFAHTFIILLSLISFPALTYADSGNECIVTLLKYYTASRDQINQWGGQELFETKRFIKYTSCRGYLVLTNNQDFGIGDECLKIQGVVRNNKLNNSYIIYVSCGYSDVIPVCVVMSKDEGKWKIDNFAIEPYNKASIDYSKPASFYYAHEGCGEKDNNTESGIIPVGEEDGDVVYTVVEKMPEFPGGVQALSRYIAENIKYPAIAQENGIQGKAMCQFVVEKDGSISEVEIVRSAGDKSLDKEALRLIKMMPKWNPGRQKGSPVRVKYTIPVDFKLQ